MSRFFSAKHKDLVAYTPGEQPKVDNLIKLNTNESPFPPSEKAIYEASGAAKRLNLYSDPTASALHSKLAENLVKHAQNESEKQANTPVVNRHGGVNFFN